MTVSCLAGALENYGSCTRDRADFQATFMTLFRKMSEKQK
jgi:hypothetical protein